MKIRIALILSLLGLHSAGGTIQTFSLSYELKTGVQLLGISVVNEADYHSSLSHTDGDTAFAADPSINFADVLADPTVYYLEVTGPSAVEGHRFEINVSATRTAGDNRLILGHPRTAEPSILDGHEVTFLIRRHVTLAEVTEQWSPNLRQGDQIIFLRNAVFTTWTFNASVQQWRIGFGIQDNKLVPIFPGEGFYFRRSHADLTPVEFTGVARNNHFAQPLQAGINLIAQGFPVASTFEFARDFEGRMVPQRNLINSTASQPSLVQLKTGDRAVSFTNGAFTSLTYNAAGRQWRIGMKSENHQYFFSPTGAVFLIIEEAQPDYVHWNPMP